MNVYLDNNIVVSLENGDYSLESIKALIPNNKIRLFYSSAHIFEIEQFKGSPALSKEDLLARRFNTIRTLFKNNYLYTNRKGNLLTNSIEDPKVVLETITQVPAGISAMKGFMNLIPTEQKESIRTDLGIEIQKLNNYTVTEVIGHLNTKLAQWGDGRPFMEIIENAFQYFPNGNSFGLPHRMVAVFELLDMLGYWKDKVTDTSNYARLWDSEQSYFASYCDYFISDDRRTRYKAGVAYGIYDIPTRIISTKKPQ